MLVHKKAYGGDLLNWKHYLEDYTGTGPRQSIMLCYANLLAQVPVGSGVSLQHFYLLHSTSLSKQKDAADILHRGESDDLAATLLTTQS